LERKHSVKCNGKVTFRNNCWTVVGNIWIPSCIDVWFAVSRVSCNNTFTLNMFF